MRKPRTESPIRLPTYEVMGHNLRIHFDEEVKTVDDPEDENRDVYSYMTAKTLVVAKRDEIVEAVMRCKYTTFGAEIAAIQNGGEDQATHQALRTEAKILADEWIGAV